MDFSHSPRTADLQARVPASVREFVQPAEAESKCEIDQARAVGKPWRGTHTAVRLADGRDEVHRNPIGQLELEQYLSPPRA